MTRFEYLGRMPYRQALELQKKLQHQRILGKISDTVLLLEHPKVITKGRRNAVPHGFVKIAREFGSRSGKSHRSDSRSRGA